jgi:hypothetical protein
MRTHRAVLLGLLAFAPVAWAQEPDEEEEDTNEEEDEEEGTRPGDTFDPDNKPDAPTVDLPNPAEETRALAGVGSETAYSERGTGEFGGSVAFALANEITSFSADPMIGYFLWDNLQLSAILGVRHLRVEDNSSNAFSVMLEPSGHFPFNDALFGVVGMGVGTALGDNVDDDPGLEAGFALAPRVGAQFLIGRSGLLNVNARYSIVLSDLDTRVAPLEGQAVLAFGNTFDVGAGYTVMF